MPRRYPLEFNMAAASPALDGLVLAPNRITALRAASRRD
jgi:hypothetical protein